MKPRTRLPRASTTASVAALTPHEQVSGAGSTQTDPGITKQQCAQILQQLESFDTEGVFTGDLTPNGRLAADGPPLTYNLRTIQSDFSNGKLSVDSVPAAFRDMCQAAILRWWSPNRQRALYTNSLLNYGNQQFQAFAPSQSASAGTESAAANAFWLAAPVFNNLLAFTYPVSALPAGFEVGVQQPTHRRMDGKKRQQADSGSLTYQHSKKSKSGSGRQTSRQYGDQKGRISHMPELSPKLQQRLATLLVLVSADADPDPSGVKQESVEDKLQARSSSALKQEASSPDVAPAGAVTSNKGVHGHAYRVRQSSAAEQSQMLKISFQSIVAGLHAGSYQSQEVVKQDVQEICRSAAEAFSSQDQESGVRRGKVLAAADQYAQLISGAIETIVEQSFSNKHLAKRTDSSSQPAVRHIPLPPSIIANTEPFRHGDWRKEPYPTRRYKRLTEYELPEEQELLKWKLQTSKRGGCQGQSCRPGQLGTYSMELGAFQTNCPCLAQNTECDAACSCAPPGTEGEAGEGCANRAASMRRALQLGKDVQEIDSWGLDCYTRKNIYDAVLESQAFGPYQARRDAGQAQPSGAKSETPGQIGGVQLDAATPAGHAMQQATHAEGAGPAGSSESFNLKAAITDWLDKVFLPAINAEGLHGWDILRACDAVKKAARDKGFEAGIKAATAIHKRASRVGHDFFRIHPKGVGLICLRPEGLAPLTLVEEYLGEMHAPWRWFEIQDAIKKTSKDELPDFYNIQLERPKDDDKGYDVLFIDAASKGSFASRISHSCSPNCQAQVMACGGRLTIALYTMRHVALGEELTFDYTSVTESEREFRAAICLCGSQLCRGSFLYFSGSKAFMQIMVREHSMLQRQALILRAATFPLNDRDRQRLKERGVGESALRGRSRTARVPEWLEKWAALIMEYVETEQALLPQELLALRPPYATYTPASAAAEAKGVSDNRLQNVVITLDKVKLCLERPGQPQGPPLRMATDQEVLQHLWTGERSVARRLLRCAACLIADDQAVRALNAADTAAQIQAAMRRYGSPYPQLQRLADVVAQQVHTPQEAKAQLLLMVDVLRDLDVQHKGGHTAAADMAYLYAMTQVWFTVERNYKGFSSPRVRLPVEALQEREGPPPDIDTGVPPSRRQRPLREVLANGTSSNQLDSAASFSGSDQEQSPESLHRPPSAAGKVAKTKSRLGRSRPASQDPLQADPDQDPTAANDPLFDPASEALPVSRPQQSAPRPQGRTASSSLVKKYGALFIWGQLSGWFKQTVYDPTASLSAERRGTLSLPDPDSCYGSGRQYTLKERGEVIQHIEKRPEAMWKINTMWSFRNDAKMYGSPMFDAVWAKVTLGCSNKMPEVVQALRQASLPSQYHKG